LGQISSPEGFHRQVLLDAVNPASVDCCHRRMHHGGGLIGRLRGKIVLLLRALHKIIAVF
jgi:hypothetical protein